MSLAHPRYIPMNIPDGNGRVKEAPCLLRAGGASTSRRQKKWLLLHAQRRREKNMRRLLVSEFGLTSHKAHGLSTTCLLVMNRKAWDDRKDACPYRVQLVEIAHSC